MRYERTALPLSYCPLNVPTAGLVAFRLVCRYERTDRRISLRDIEVTSKSLT